MSNTPASPLIVLKFGGSVLLDHQRLRIAVHEIYRWRRDGYRVIAVVSALAGRTEALIAQADELFADASDQAKAAIIAAGELESASLLGIHLDRAGIPASVLTPGAVGLIAAGDPLDADPQSIDPSPIQAALESDSVVVLPGFVAIDEQSQTVTLGRGGSDLTAIFLAHQLNADRCRLIKDVDGLYDRDPATTDPDLPPPRRYQAVNYQQALETDGSIIQHKAIRYAQHTQTPFELTRFNAARPTIISNTTQTTECPPDLPKPRTVAICGLGTVGAGVLELITQLPELFSVTGLSSRTPAKHPDHPIPITTDALELAASDADIVLELIGGLDPALDIARNALTTGSHVVTANKALIAEHGNELNDLAQQSNRRLLASASVGGVVPVLESLETDQVRSVSGVLNGTGNFVLGALESGQPLDQAVTQAQTLGFAESDPSRDLDGRDALDKLLVIAQQLNWSIPEESVSRQCITEWKPTSCTQSTAKQHAAVTKDQATVTIEQLDRTSTLGSLTNEWNAAVIEYDDGSTRTVRGKGAGRWPTSESVLADLLQLSRETSDA